MKEEEEGVVVVIECQGRPNTKKNKFTLSTDLEKSAELLGRLGGRNRVVQEFSHFEIFSELFFKNERERDFQLSLWRVVNTHSFILD